MTSDRYIIKRFRPAQIEFSKDSFNNFLSNPDKNWKYSSSGKASIYHILKSFGNIDKILIPSYICSSVILPLKKLNISPVFYDIDLDDLNGSLASIEYISSRHKIKAVLVASLYGNPANLSEIERFCFEKNIIMLDDAAQSFGSLLNNRQVGTFGNAGFFSFSPGKATAGHMGAFFWTDFNYTFEYSYHCLIHLLNWLEFYFTRYKCYWPNILFYKDIMIILRQLSQKVIDLTSDGICDFEKKILGGIINGSVNYMFDFRKNYFDLFQKEFSSAGKFRIIKHIRGVPNNHKIVLLFENQIHSEKIYSYLIKNKIFLGKGYEPLYTNRVEVPNAYKIRNRILELPIEDSNGRMDYLFNVLTRAISCI